MGDAAKRGGRPPRQVPAAAIQGPNAGGERCSAVATPPRRSGLLQREEDFPVQQFVAELGIEAFDVAILPRRHGVDVGGAGISSRNPPSHDLRDELRGVVRADEDRHPALEHEVNQRLDCIRGVQPPIDLHGEGLTGELVDHAEHLDLPAVMRPVLDELVSPDLVGPLCPQANAGSTIQPEPTSLRLSSRYLQLLAPPGPLDPIRVQHPAGIAQERSVNAI